MRLAAVVILYYPDPDLISRINSYLSHIDRLYVIDNSESPAHLDFLSQKIKYMQDGLNKGIAARLNQAANFAIEEGYSWMLTMDQDSYFKDDNFINLTRCLDAFTAKNNIAQFGIQFQNPHLQSAKCEYRETSILITSGSIINLQAFQSIGSFDEALFIDQVDFDFCFRAKIKGYMIIEFTNVFLQHSLGNESMQRSFKSLKKTNRSLHSPIRIYYMTRNYLYMKSRYSKLFPDEIAHTRKDLLYRIKNNFLYGNAKIALIKNIMQAIVDYRRNKMGQKS